jgi:hypothetical protein
MDRTSYYFIAVIQIIFSSGVPECADPVLAVHCVHNTLDNRASDLTAFMLAHVIHMSSVVNQRGYCSILMPLKEASFLFIDSFLSAISNHSLLLDKWSCCLFDSGFTSAHMMNYSSQPITSLQKTPLNQEPNRFQTIIDLDGYSS